MAVSHCEKKRIQFETTTCHISSKENRKIKVHFPKIKKRKENLIKIKFIKLFHKTSKDSGKLNFHL